MSWKKAGWQQVTWKNGDEVYLIDGDSAVVTGSELEKPDEAIKVYNLEVEGYNTYFVGDDGVLVHNYEDNAWNNYQHEHAGEGKSVSELAKDYNSTKPQTSSIPSGKVHGNSLDYDGINYGYVLKEKGTGDTLKYGESINPTHRYTQSYLDDHKAEMIILI